MRSGARERLTDEPSGACLPRATAWADEFAQRSRRAARRWPAVTAMPPRSGNPVDESDVREMFDGIAPVYDRMNTLMTFGSDGRWRSAAVHAANLQSGDRVVDVACGTGKLAVALADVVGPFGRVVGVDLAPRMIDLARAAQPALVQLEFRVANALALPFDDAAFDAATIGFGMRNLADFEAGFRELARVVRPGGRVVCLELSVPWPLWWGRLFHGSFRRVAPVMGAVFGHRDAYRYLPSSLDGFPDPNDLAATMRAAGLADVTFRRLGLGSVALHVGTVPALPER
jgi:demethylmenaquinone methyltransferase / 2-methoxy-6-polyprenyl-1,4-benzoquinol methylase